ncbi:MBOAT family O-acyltransferase [Taibaiella soli]|uniref:MBOAT family protein n=1 Tax=Taibaiella soli TaxID=1649169 RepID=A0A2W2AEV4_9BACT|nr:MBOAT family O-acyltransferase [Taibaiella soli]PZF73821.1 MBOAT family protein [Taibaiella soli]
MQSFDLSLFLKQFLYDPKNPLLFNNGFFVYFFAVFISLYYLLRNNATARTWLFCFFSLYFFYKASGFFVGLVLLSAVIDYGLSNAIYKARTKSTKKLLLITSVVINLGLLFYFKYTNFFIALCNDFLAAKINPLNILLPVGISFYTFENLSYTVDVYRGEFEPEQKFMNYLLFLSFFPKLVMGPIVRAKDFIPQLHKPYEVNQQDFSRGFYLIVSGLFKKLVISDFLTTNFVDFIFSDPSRYTGLECLMAVYGYAIVIYCDFSGYSDVAIGMAKWLGITIPVNFKSPYQSKSVTEFWKRWHISLSSWLQDYLYIPLGGNRKGKVRTYVNLFITMLLGGFWHGASWNFIIWGAMHGIALAMHKLWMSNNKQFIDRQSNKTYYRLMAQFVTFQFVCFCWIFFKAVDFNTATQLIMQITHHFSLSVLGAFWSNYQYVIYMMALGYLLHIIPDDFADKMLQRAHRVPMFAYVGVFLVFVMVYAHFKTGEPVMPIYLQF